jgi:hypothetical protein
MRTAKNTDDAMRNFHRHRDDAARLRRSLDPLWLRQDLENKSFISSGTARRVGRDLFDRA